MRCRLFAFVLLLLAELFGAGFLVWAQFLKDTDKTAYYDLYKEWDPLDLEQLRGYTLNITVNGNESTIDLSDLVSEVDLSIYSRQTASLLNHLEKSERPHNEYIAGTIHGGLFDTQGENAYNLTIEEDITLEFMLGREVVRSETVRSCPLVVSKITPMLTSSLPCAYNYRNSLCIDLRAIKTLYIMLESQSPELNIADAEVKLGCAYEALSLDKLSKDFRFLENVLITSLNVEVVDGRSPYIAYVLEDHRNKSVTEFTLYFVTLVLAFIYTLVLLVRESLALRNGKYLREALSALTTEQGVEAVMNRRDPTSSQLADLGTTEPRLSEDYTQQE